MAHLPGPAALVHEWFTPRSVGGAELVVQQLDALLERPQLAALVDGESRRAGSWLEGRSIHTSFVQQLPCRSALHHSLIVNDLNLFSQPTAFNFICRFFRGVFCNTVHGLPGRYL